MSAVRTPAVPFAEDATPLPLGTDSVVRRGLIFRAGDYPDKKYSMTAAELADAARDFNSVPIDLSHTSTVLDGHLGSLFEVEAKGDELHGSVRLPRWLDSLLDSKSRKVSCYWDRDTKRLQKLSIVPNPRIEDAVLMAAFADQTYGGRSAIQQLHDRAAEYGAVCKRSNSRKPGQPMFHSADELAAIQAIHDAAVTGGAKCSIIPDDANRPVFGSDTAGSPSPAKLEGQAGGSGGGTAFTARKRAPAADRAAQRIHDWLRKLDQSVCDPKSKAIKPSFSDHPKQLKALKSMHDSAVEHGATCPGVAMSVSPSKPNGKVGFMSTWRKKLIAGLMKGKDEPVEFTDDEAVEAATELAKEVGSLPPSKPSADFGVRASVDDDAAAFADTPAGRAARAERDRLRAESEARATADRDAAEKAVKSKAVTFADTLTRGDAQQRIPACLTPHQAKAFQPLFERIARDDAEHGTKVTFAKDGKDTEGTRWDALVAAFSTLPAHGMTVEQIAPNGNLSEDSRILFNAPAESAGAPGAKPNETAEQRGAREYRERFSSTTNGVKS
jgi:hypothetical protein